MAITNNSDDQKLKVEALLELMQDKHCFDVLRRWTDRINIFEVLKIARAEIRHSNLLAWLLDPNENHEMGSDFLYSLITDLSKHHSYEFVDDDVLPVIGTDDAIKLLSSDLTQSQIFREWNHIDVMILLPNKYIIAIENKVDAKESEEQLPQYKGKLNKYFPTQDGYNHIMIFLTPNGDSPSAGNEDWKIYTYSDVVSILKDVYIAHQNHLSIEANILIDNYIKILENEIMDSQELKNLCNEIYTKHKQALDLIFENKESVTSMVSSVCYNKLLEIKNNYQIDFNDSRKPGVYIQFTTDMINQMKGELNDESVEVYYQFEFKPNSENGCNGWLKLVLHNTTKRYDKGKADIINSYAVKNKIAEYKDWQWKHIWGTSTTVFSEIDDNTIGEWVEQSLKEMKNYENGLQISQ